MTKRRRVLDLPNCNVIDMIALDIDVTNILTWRGYGTMPVYADGNESGDLRFDRTNDRTEAIKKGCPEPFMKGKKK